MSGDTIGTGETYDGSDNDVVPEPADSAAPPEHADPGADLDRAEPEATGDDDRTDLDDFEPDVAEPDARPVQPAPEERGSGIGDGEVDDAAAGDADDAATQARQEIEREAIPAAQTRGDIEDMGETDEPVRTPPADDEPADNTEEPEDTADPAPTPAAPAETTDQAEPADDAESAEPGDEDPEDGGQSPEDGADDADGDAEADEERDRQAAAEAAGRAAVDDEVEGPVDGEEDTSSDVDDVDEQLSEHERDLEAKGVDGEPDVDLDELEEMLGLIDLDTDLIASQHQWTEGDDSWEGARDAARSGPMEEFEEDLAGADTGAPDNVAYPPFAPAPADAGTVQGGERTAPVVLLNRDAPPAPEAEPADDLDDALLPATRDFDTGDTPGAARDYPPELVDYTDKLMGQGDAGEEAAIAALERYELTGELPADVIPQQMGPGNAPDDGGVPEGTIPLFE